MYVIIAHASCPPTPSLPWAGSDITLILNFGSIRIITVDCPSCNSGERMVRLLNTAYVLFFHTNWVDLPSSQKRKITLLHAVYTTLTLYDVMYLPQSPVNTFSSKKQYASENG